MQLRSLPISVLDVIKVTHFVCSVVACVCMLIGPLMQEHSMHKVVDE
jgi:hypothetical protein